LKATPRARLRFRAATITLCSLLALGLCFARRGIDWLARAQDTQESLLKAGDAVGAGDAAREGAGFFDLRGLRGLLNSKCGGIGVVHGRKGWRRSSHPRITRLG